MSVWSVTYTALVTLGLPMAEGVYLSASGAELPDRYLVYFLVSAPPVQHADNAETLRNFRMQVSAYTRLGLHGLPDIDAAMVAAGFTRSMQRELPYNTLTRHFGLALEYIFLEQE
jgi:hypothetical protein